MVGIKTSVIFLEVAIWWRVGIKRGCRFCGFGTWRGGEDGCSESPRSGCGGRESSSSLVSILTESRREERNVARDWQIRRVVEE